MTQARNNTLLAFIEQLIFNVYSTTIINYVACGPGEIYDYPVKGCVCLSPGNMIRCPVPPKHARCSDFPLDECNMCTCELSKKSFTCEVKWCSWIFDCETERILSVLYLNIYGNNSCANKEYSINSSSTYEKFFLFPHLTYFLKRLSFAYQSSSSNDLNISIAGAEST